LAGEHSAAGGYGGEISVAVSKRRREAAAGGVIDVVHALEGGGEIDRRVGWAIAGDFDDSQSDGCRVFAARAAFVELQRAPGELRRGDCGGGGAAGGKNESDGGRGGGCAAIHGTFPVYT